MVSEPEVVRDWSYRCKSLSGPGLHTGRGCGLLRIDPLFSSGVHLALTYAALASVVVGVCAGRPDDRGTCGEDVRADVLPGVRALP